MRALVFSRSLVGLFVVAMLALIATPRADGAKPPAAHTVPFKGVSEQQAISAVRAGPDLLLVTTVGEGRDDHRRHRAVRRREGDVHVRDLLRHGDGPLVRGDRRRDRRQALRPQRGRRVPRGEYRP